MPYLSDKATTLEAPPHSCISSEIDLEEMAILAGFAGIYLRGYLVNYLLKTLYVKRQANPEKIIKNKVI